MSKEGAPERPLSGLRVVEGEGAVATRYCGRLLSRLGADVVQVRDRSDDSVGHRGEAGRAFNAWLDEGKATAPDLYTALAHLDAAGQRSLAIAGQTARALREMDQAIAANGGGVVRVGITWFGEAGPYAHWRGDDAVIEALSGLAFAFGLPQGPPILAQGCAPQILAGVNGFIGGLAALMNEAVDVSRVDVNVLESTLCLTEPGAVAAAADPAAQSTRRGVNRYSPVYPSSVYPTIDGHVGVTALTPAQWAALCGLIERPDLAAEPRFATSLTRTDCADELDRLLAPLIARNTTGYWVEAGERLRIPITPAPRPRDLPSMPHWAGRSAFAAVAATGAFGPTLPFRISHDGVAAPRPAGGTAGPLSGVRVADFSMGWAGPLAARYLGDLGADVVKVETGGKPDWWRGWEIVEAQDPPLHELPRHFMAVNRSKRGVDIDLLTPEGRGVAEAIVASADVVIENHGPGVMERLGLGQAAQRRLRPGVVSVSMPPFGFGGPLTRLRAYGSTVEQASGLPFVNGHADWAPSMQHVALGDPVAGLYAAAAALAGLWGRNRLGGAEIDLCQVECVFQLGADAIIADQLGGVERTGSRRSTAAPVCVVAGAGEEAWLAVSVDGDTAWRALCRVIDDPAMAADWTLPERKAREDAIEASIARWAAARDPASAARALQAAGVAAAPVSPAHDLSRDRHLCESGFWTTAHRPYIGDHLIPNSPIRFDGARPTIVRAAPTLGQHTAEVLAELA
jgi:crotonobetainyl-CoA:carnitine CoA-transferase CaiB-like acyl-CoA transferase